MIFSGTIMERRAPIEEPHIAAMMDGRARRKLTSRFLMKRKVAMVVPQEDESLLVATAIWGGSPAMK